MRAKMLAAFVFLVVCASGTAAHAGPPPRTFLVVLEEMAARWFGRTATELKLSPTVQRLETAPLTRPLGNYHSPYETQNFRQPDEFVRQLAIPKQDLTLAAPAQDSTASADKTSKAGPLIGGSITGTGTYCLLSGTCPGQRGK
ncbi:hypothetical protein NLM31_20820 [Bradyrhizobium sp. CCGUVB4N]|uniref:hypothetical protein n=1 Tax=Bradyrhizobium sp. CCGUVB4N TaxID=2949631 RepID=UPI0020B3EF31|nr:hypothetical protein [Bradyrhizobium sp. CCGUVB4N]MCP3382812.1 hypothetical protein [Bradyrhizobium sp. CCGUVB4N]